MAWSRNPDRIFKRSRPSTVKLITDYLEAIAPRRAATSEIVAFLDRTNSPYIRRLLTSLVASGQISLEVDEDVYPYMNLYGAAALSAAALPPGIFEDGAQGATSAAEKRL